MCGAIGAGGCVEDACWDLPRWSVQRGGCCGIEGTDLELTFIALDGDFYAWVCKCGICIGRIHVAGAALAQPIAVVRGSGTFDLRSVMGERAAALEWAVDHQHGAGADAMPRTEISV